MNTKRFDQHHGLDSNQRRENNITKIWIHHIWQGSVALSIWLSTIMISDCCVNIQSNLNLRNTTSFCHKYTLACSSRSPLYFWRSPDANLDAANVRFGWVSLLLQCWFESRSPQYNHHSCFNENCWSTIRSFRLCLDHWGLGLSKSALNLTFKIQFFILLSSQMIFFFRSKFFPQRIRSIVVKKAPPAIRSKV